MATSSNLTHLAAEGPYGRAHSGVSKGPDRHLQLVSAVELNDGHEDPAVASLGRRCITPISSLFSITAHRS